MTHIIPDLHLCASDSHQCFPYYAYDEDGSKRRENVTDWALGRFREHYGDKTITKWEIFYYVYGVLHHPAYREKFAENLKRELPRIPLIGVGAGPFFRAGAPPSPKTKGTNKGTASRTPTGPVDAFWAFAKAGRELAHLHIDYEKLEPYPLKFVEAPAVAPGFSPAPAALKGGATVGANRVRPRAERRSALQVPLSYRVEDKMRLSKDKTSLKINPSLTLAGIPPETFEYRLGNRSALDWVIDQYQVTENKASGIRSDPNRADDPEYIVRLVGQVVRVSLETVRFVKEIHTLPLA